MKCFFLYNVTDYSLTKIFSGQNIVSSRVSEVVWLRYISRGLKMLNKIYVKMLSLLLNFPYLGLRGLLFIFTNRKGLGTGWVEDIWKKLPIKNLRSLMLLPDGNKVICMWKDRPEVRTIMKEIYHLRVYDRLFELKKGFTVIDVGAHVGIYTLKSAKKVSSEGQIIAIEPEDENFRSLIKNIRINNITNVLPLKLALSNFDGKSRLYINEWSRMHSLVRKTSKATEVRVATLDKLIEEIGVNHVDLLKMDAEGAELEILKGSEKALDSKKINKIVIAAYHTPSQADEISKYLKSKNYEIKIQWIKERKSIFLYAHA